MTRRIVDTRLSLLDAPGFNGELEAKLKNGGTEKLRINEEVGRGGSVIAYRAALAGDGAEAGTTRIVKEFYPLGARLEEISRDPETGGLVVPDAARERFDKLRSRFVAGLARFGEYYEWDQGKHTTAEPDCGESSDGSTSYAIARLAGEHLLSLEPPRDINSIAQVMVSVCEALSPFHKHGVLYGDVKPANLFWYEIDMHALHARLFDFDTAERLEDIKSGECAYFSCSEKWASPEQAGWFGGTASASRLSFASDFYSVGCVFFWLLTGRGPSREANDSSSDAWKLEKGLFDWESNKRYYLNLDCTKNTLAMIKGIASKTLRQDPSDRFQSAAEAAKAFSALYEETRKSAVTAKRLDSAEGKILAKLDNISARITGNEDSAKEALDATPAERSTRDLLLEGQASFLHNLGRFYIELEADEGFLGSEDSGVVFLKRFLDRVLQMEWESQNQFHDEEPHWNDDILDLMNEQEWAEWEEAYNGIAWFPRTIAYETGMETWELQHAAQWILNNDFDKSGKTDAELRSFFDCSNPDVDGWNLSEAVAWIIAKIILVLPFPYKRDGMDKDDLDVSSECALWLNLEKELSEREKERRADYQRFHEMLRISKPVERASLTMGSWGGEPIEWLIAKRDRKNVLLISEKVIDIEPYNTELFEYARIGWKDCSLRKWLNGPFLEQAFTDEERDRIELAEIDNPDSPKCAGGEDTPTKDYVFCLSVNEAREIFRDDLLGKLAKTTPFAESKKPAKRLMPDDFAYPGTKWWLRSPSEEEVSRAYCIGDDGTEKIPVFDNGEAGVRPAMWINGRSIASNGNRSSIAGKSTTDGNGAGNQPSKQMPTACKLSWEELGEVARLISQQKTPENAIGIAKDYGLIDSEGNLNLLYKDLVLKDGQKARVRIVGIAHDELEDGRKAGITFGFMSPIGFRAMNTTQTNKGGWEESELRSLLDAYFLKKVIPDEVSKNICTVLKPTNNVGKTKKTSCITNTRERLWLFSRIELAGEWNAKAVWVESPDAPLYDLIADAEGRQYQLFEELGVDDPYGLVDLAHQDPIVVYESAGSKKYWLRSPDPDNDSDYGVVLEKGQIANGYSSTGLYGVLPGFCF